MRLLQGELTVPDSSGQPPRISVNANATSELMLAGQHAAYRLSRFRIPCHCVFVKLGGDRDVCCGDVVEELGGLQWNGKPRRASERAIFATVFHLSCT